jgi:hypothetical protein
MNSPDNRHGNEDDESDLSDDPVLSALNKDLGSVLRLTDNRLFIFLGAALAACYLPEYLHVPPVAAYVLYVGAIACILGGIGFTILSVI